MATKRKPARDKIVQTRFNRHELRYVKKRAKECGVSVSEWIRTITVGNPFEMGKALGWTAVNNLVNGGDGVNNQN